VDGKRGIRPHLFGLLPEDLVAFLGSRGIPLRDDAARRFLGHAVSHGRPGFPGVRPIGLLAERAITELVAREPLEVLERVENPSDHFVKYLFRSPDGALSEAVRIPLEAPGRFTVCLSSQVGCAMRCAFCATGRLGLTRNLAAWEMVSAFVAVRDEAPGTVTAAVFMGQGEPLANYDEVIRAARLLCHPCGGRIKAEMVTISTLGLVPAIHRFAAERHRFRLIVSLTSTVPERRERLLPAAWPVDDVVAAIRALAGAARKRVTVAWVVLGGENTGDDEVEGIRRLLGDLPLRLNLIDVNDPRPDGFRQATPDELARFRTRLRELGVPVVRRFSGGAGTHAACGMLVSKRLTSPSSR
jgi:23S rRNA (adenine2503-C2)-methyltransferase